MEDAAAAYEKALAIHPNYDEALNNLGSAFQNLGRFGEARAAFEYLSRISEEELGLCLASYGLLVDDLHVYRAIAAQRPIGIAHPQAPATRALMDVARMLSEDARSRPHG